MLKRPALLLVPLVLASCAPSLLAPNASTVDGLFLQANTGSNLFEIQTSQLALNKSSTEGVRAYAQRMINEHTAAQNTVNTLAAARRVPLPKALPPELQIKVNTLSTLSGAAFDTAYLNEQVVGHQATASVMQNEQTAGKDAEVVAFAAQQLPLVLDHLREAQALGGTAPQAAPAPATPAPTAP